MNVIQMYHIYVSYIVNKKENSDIIYKEREECKYIVL